MSSTTEFYIHFFERLLGSFKEQFYDFFIFHQVAPPPFTYILRFCSEKLHGERKFLKKVFVVILYHAFLIFS